MSTEAYVYSKRGLRIQQKRPSTTKEADSFGERDLVRQKRPTYTAKEAYAYGKRGLRIWQKRPIPLALLARALGPECILGCDKGFLTP